MGNGLAGKFSLALSKVVDKSAGGNSDLIEMLHEINANDNLTVKLSSVSKIVASFKGGNKSSSIAKKRLEETLK